MTKTSAPILTPNPASARKLDQDSSRSSSKYDKNPGAITLGLAMNMAWQMAIVVLLPIIGGHAIDSHFKTTPVWTVVGLVVATIGMIVVVRQTLQQLNEYMKTSETGDKEEPHDK